MKNLLTSTSGRKWQRYNRWRSKNRALDRERRIERLAKRKAEYVDNYSAPSVPKPRLKSWAIVRISFCDGENISFSIKQTPFGLTISPTMAGKKLQQILKNK